MALDKILDEINAYRLQQSADELRAQMGRNGTKTEPTSFSYPQLVEFYLVVLQKVQEYVSYSQKHPAHEKTTQEKRKLVKEHIAELLDFHTAWNILRVSEPLLTPEAFKRMDPAKRHERFVAVLEENVKAYPGLYETRAKVIQLCVNQGILPQEYK